MVEIRKEVLNERFFTPVFREEGFFPAAPADALSEYARLKREWMDSYPEVPGVFPGVSLRPIKVKGMTSYVLIQEIWTIQRG